MRQASLSVTECFTPQCGLSSLSVLSVCARAAHFSAPMSDLLRSLAHTAACFRGWDDTAGAAVAGQDGPAVYDWLRLVAAGMTALVQFFILEFIFSKLLWVVT